MVNPLMPKLTLSSLTSSYRSNAALNANFDAIEAAIENTLSRDGTSPNAMTANFDMGSYRAVNLAAPVDDNDAIRKVDVDSGIGPDVTTVADNITSVTTVATSISDVTAVAADLAGADTIGDASTLLAITAPGIVAKDTGGSPVSRTITGSTGISVSNGDGGAGNPTISLDAELVDIAGITPADGTFIVGDGSDFVGESGDTALTSLGGGTAGIATFKGASAGSIRSTLSLVPGTDVVAYDANLQGFVDTFTLPTADGASGQALTTDGLGTVSWVTPAGGGDTLKAANEHITGAWTWTDGDIQYAASFSGASSRSIFSKIEERVSVRDFGALGDVIAASDGAIISGSNTFTSASASFATADVGKVIGVAGARADGDMLGTTIASINSPTSIELTDAAGATVSGSAYEYGTNDTTSIQAAVDAMPANGGKVYLSRGIYYATNINLAGTDESRSNVLIVGDGMGASEIRKPPHGALTTNASRKSNTVYALEGNNHGVYDITVKGNLGRGGYTPDFVTKHTLGDTLGSEGRVVSVAADGTSSTGAATDDSYQITASGAGQTSDATNISNDVASGYVTLVYDQSTGIGAYNESDGSGYFNWFENDNDFAYRSGVYMNGKTARMVNPHAIRVEATGAVYGGFLLGKGPLSASEAYNGTESASTLECYSHNNGATNIGGGGKYRARHNFCRVGQTDSSGIRFDEGCEYGEAIGNTIDCNDISNSNSAISIYASNGQRIIGNDLKGSLVGVSATNSDDVTVIGNNVRDCNRGVTATNADFSVIASNVIEDTTGTGILVNSGSHVSVHDNKLLNIGDGSTDDGIDASGDRHTIHNNGMDTVAGDGLVIAGTRHQIYSNITESVTGAEVVDSTTLSNVFNNGSSSTFRLEYNGNILFDSATGGTVYLGGQAGDESFQVVPRASATNRLSAQGGLNGSSVSPRLAPVGDETNIDVRYAVKGSANHRFDGAAVRPESDSTTTLGTNSVRWSAGYFDSLDVQGGYPLIFTTDTANNTSISDITASINTVGKFQGKVITSTTDGTKYFATGAAAGDTWEAFTTASDRTPS